MKKRTSNTRTRARNTRRSAPAARRTASGYNPYANKRGYARPGQSIYQGNKGNSQSYQQPQQGAFQQRDMSGALFPNDRPKSDRSPNYNGKVMIDGVLYWLNGWAKRARNGRPYISLAVQPVENQEPVDTDIPF